MTNPKPHERCRMNRPAAPDLALREATVDDAPSIAVLATHVFVDTYAREGIRPTLAREALADYSTEAVRAQLGRARATCVLALSGAHLVGFAQVLGGARHPLLPHVPGAELERLYVLPRSAGRGVGTALLRCAEVIAAGQGASIPWLEAWTGNEHARGFYAGQGYSDVGATSYRFEQDTYENRVFARDLGSSATR